jgi:predicted aldo/keto reductase-like oxidoreductase
MTKQNRDDRNKSKHSSRRDFLKSSFMGGLVSVFAAGKRPTASNTTLPGDESEKTPKIRRYRTLGRTGFKVSDISSGDPNDEGVLRFLYESGVNYFDTAESYARGERMIGDLIKGIDRKSIFVTTKLVIGANRNKDHFIQRARKCLERLNTDHIDCLMNHMPPSVADLLTPGFLDAIEELKREGRVRFCGVSHHGSYYDDTIREPMDKVLLTAVEDGRFDVILPVYNFLNEHDGDHILAEAAKKNVGTVVMKTNPIGHYYDFKSKVESIKEKSGEEYEYYSSMLELADEKAALTKQFIKKYKLGNPNEIRDTAIKYVISNKNVSTAILGFHTYEDVKRFVGLSGSELSGGDRGMLDHYREYFGDLYCRHACGRCESSCPHGVPVNTIMRYHHYFDAQGREKEAIAKYAKLPTNRADLCRGCEGMCERICPYGVPIKGLLCISHEALTLA